jgi:hypothetical protein
MSAVRLVATDVFETTPIVVGVPDVSGTLFISTQDVTMDIQLPVYVSIAVQDKVLQTSNTRYQVIGHVLSYRKRLKDITIRVGFDLVHDDDFPLQSLQRRLVQKMKANRVQSTYLLQRDSLVYLKPKQLIAARVEGWLLYDVAKSNHV